MRFWLKRLINQLRYEPMVDHLRVKSNRLMIYYATGFRRNYIHGPTTKRHIYRFPIDRKGGTLSNPIKVGYQYQWVMRKRPDLEPYFMVKRERIDNSTYIERELMIHQILYKLQRTKLIPAYFDPEELVADFKLIKDIWRSYADGVYSVHSSCGQHTGGPRPGRPLMETYNQTDDIRRHPKYSNSAIRHAFGHDRVLYIALQRIVQRTRWDLTVCSIRRMLTRMRFGPKYFSPVIYKIILHQLIKPAGRIVTDPDPRLGVKAIACATLGAHYNPIGGVSQSLVDAIGLTLADPGEQHDIVMLDNYFSPLDLEQAMTWRERCKEMLVFVPHDQMEEARIKYKPFRIVKVRVNLGVRIPDYLFQFKN